MTAWLLGLPARLRLWAGVALAAVGAVLAAYLLGRRDGRKDERGERNAADAQGYIEERRRQDRLDLGVGASDAERVRMLRDIADRGGAGNP